MSIRNMTITVNGKRYEVTVETDDGRPQAPVALVPNMTPAVVTPQRPAVAPAAPAAPAASIEGGVTSPLAGKVIQVHVSEGQAVTEGQVVITLEAMKMNTEITAAAAATVRKVHVGEGALVDEGQTLIDLA